MLIVLEGRPATGKTTLAYELCRRLGTRTTVLDIDATAPLVVAAAASHGDTLITAYDKPYRGNLTQAQYQTLLHFAEAAFQAGVEHVVMIGAFDLERADTNWLTQMRIAFGDVRPLVLWCSAEIARKRLIRRGEAWDAMRLTHWGKEMHRYGPPSIEIQACYPILNTDDQQGLAKRALRILDDE